MGAGFLTAAVPAGASVFKMREVSRHKSIQVLADHVRNGRGSLRRMALDKVDGEPALGSTLGPELIAVGFEEGPRRLSLSA